MKVLLRAGRLRRGRQSARWSGQGRFHRTRQDAQPICRRVADVMGAGQLAEFDRFLVSGNRLITLAFDLHTLADVEPGPTGELSFELRMVPIALGELCGRHKVEKV